MKRVNLIALQPSIEVSNELTLLQQESWKKEGVISFLSPHIPLIWSEDEFIPFEMLTLPYMPPSLLFDTIVREDSHYYLSSREKRWSSLYSELRSSFNLSRSESFPFPAKEGFYLGQIAPPSSFSVTNSDWRLLYLTLFWEGEHYYNYKFYSVHHLLCANY